MKRLALALCLISYGLNTFADCSNSDVAIKVNITQSVSEKAYEHGSAVFDAASYVEVYEFASGETIYIDLATLTDDTSGNYTIEGENTSNGTAIFFTHDHETWDEDGIEGSYTSPSGIRINLDHTYCELDELIQIN